MMGELARRGYSRLMCAAGEGRGREGTERASSPKTGKTAPQQSLYMYQSEPAERRVTQKCRHPPVQQLCLAHRAGAAAVHGARDRAASQPGVGLSPRHRATYAFRSWCFTSSHFGSQLTLRRLVSYSLTASRSMAYSTRQSLQFTLCLRWQTGGSLTCRAVGRWAEGAPALAWVGLTGVLTNRRSRRCPSSPAAEASSRQRSSRTSP